MSHKEPDWMCPTCKDTGKVRAHWFSRVFLSCPECLGIPASRQPKSDWMSPPPPPMKATGVALHAAKKGEWVKVRYTYKPQ